MAIGLGLQVRRGLERLLSKTWRWVRGPRGGASVRGSRRFCWALRWSRILQEEKLSLPLWSGHGSRSLSLRPTTCTLVNAWPTGIGPCNRLLDRSSATLKLGTFSIRRTFTEILSSTPLPRRSRTWDARRFFKGIVENKNRRAPFSNSDRFWPAIERSLEFDKMLRIVSSGSLDSWFFWTHRYCRLSAMRLRTFQLIAARTMRQTAEAAVERFRLIVRVDELPETFRTSDLSRSWAARKKCCHLADFRFEEFPRRIGCRTMCTKKGLGRPHPKDGRALSQFAETSILSQVCAKGPSPFWRGG